MSRRQLTQVEYQRYAKRMTDKIYVALFGADGDGLRKRIGLPLDDTFDDDNLRDHMGVEALQALAEVESACAVMMRANPQWSPDRIIVECGVIARKSAMKWQKQCAENGVDFLRGKHVVPAWTPEERRAFGEEYGLEYDEATNWWKDIK